MRKKSEIAEAFARRDDLGAFNSFFLVGIGGAGMSALAVMLKDLGHRVSGSDSTQSPVTRDLERAGITVHLGHSESGIFAGDAVILTDAIDLSISPEVRRARALGCPLFRRSQLLGFLLKNRKVIAITGTHGKTTTTGLTGAAMIEAGMDPLVIVGAVIPEWGSAVRHGDGEWAVVEACEAYDSLCDLDPTIAVVTNLELDHSDFHGDYATLLKSVVNFAERATDSVIYCEGDAGATEVAALSHAPSTQAYGSFDGPALRLPGLHNRLNANAAFKAATRAGADPAKAIKGIIEFSGAERRLQVHREGPITVVDDYAHHPSEIVASLGALRERYPDRRIIVVYQPHLYSRTQDFLDSFGSALSLADIVVLTDIYPAREDPIPGISSARIAEGVSKPVHYIPSRFLLPRTVAEFATPGDLVVGMGAGTVSEFVPEFLAELDRSGPKRVAVIEGGDSAEREVSLLSAREIERALLAKGYDAYRLDLTDALLKGASLAGLTGGKRPDLAFLAVHGTNAEDGAIQGLLEILHIPYTGSGIQSSALAMDKDRTKIILKSVGVQVPESVLLTTPKNVELPLPLVVKPNAQGSTIGLSFVSKPDELDTAIQKAFQYGETVLVEQRIFGMEISVPVFGERALPPVEICPKSESYDFAAKYSVGATEEIVPARLSSELLHQAEQIALTCHQALKCEGATRTDMIVQSDGEIYVLEVNTLPGMTGTSLLPNSAQAAGIFFEELVDWIAQDALTRHGQKK
ncbi:MAG: D-alanine--D-alanine ligase [Fimbriimonadaceae bacterium]